MIDTTPGTANPKVTFCSAVSEASGEDPAGSAWALRRIALVELPLPWPYNVLEGRNVPPDLSALLYEIWDADGADTGMIGIASDPDYSVDGMRRVIDLRQRDDLAATYHRDEYLVPEDGLVAHLRRLAFEPEHPEVARHLVDADSATRDFLVCTHGAIDVCCATFGYPVYKLMRAMADTAPVPTRVWRSTHFGGHRFAATALEAPQGRYWGHLKPEMLAGLVRQTASPRDLRRHYRGWAALTDRLWQIAEAELLATAGWDWRAATITCITGEATEPDGGTLTIAFQHPAGDGEVDVDIVPTGSVKTMDQSKTAELREVPQYEVRIVVQRPDGCLTRLGDNGTGA
jgi:hypothetical protein